MRRQLEELQQRIVKLQKQGVPAPVIADVRTDQLDKILNERRIEKETKLRDILVTRKNLLELYAEPKRSPIEMVARQMELDSKFTTLPLSELKKLDLTKFEPDELRALTGTFRRRGDHGSADDVYRHILIKEKEYLGNPMYQQTNKDEARVNLLYQDHDKSSIWIGNDVKDIKKEDFAEMTPSGGMHFKSLSENGVYRDVEV
jgi:hypothetical protein